MFETFDSRAQRVVVLAQEEARGLGHNRIDTEHLLLGLLEEPDGLARQVLQSYGLTLIQARALVADHVSPGEGSTQGFVPMASGAKEVLDLAQDEARAQGQTQVGTEHLLLGLTRQTGGVAARILADCTAGLVEIRTAISEAMQRKAPHPPQS